MPFESKSQRRFMYAKHPEIATEFEEATPKGASLPEHKAKQSALKRLAKKNGQDRKRPPDEY